MNRLLFVVSAVALCAPVFAQTVYSPHAIYQTRAGGGYAYFFGNYSGGRVQHADGNLRGQVTIVTNISYGFDNRLYSAYTGAGRSWANVSLKLSECNIATMTNNLDANATKTPTQAFSGSATWPTITGTPSGTGWEIRFPCRPFISNGNTDLLADYQFTGGTLVNNVAWATNQASLYYLDSFTIGNFASSQPNYIWNGAGVCVDSGTTNPRLSAYTYMYAAHYGPTYPNASYKNKFRLYMYSYYTAPSAPVLHLLDFVGGAPGVSFPGLTCANFYVAGSPALLIFPKMAGLGTAYSGFNYFGFPGGLIPVIPAVIGEKLYSQAAWTDSVTGAMKASIGTEITIPELPPFTDYSKTKRLCYINPYSTLIYRYNQFYANPIMKYN